MSSSFLNFSQKATGTSGVSKDGSMKLRPKGRSELNIRWLLLEEASELGATTDQWQQA